MRTTGKSLGVSSDATSNRAEWSRPSRACHGGEPDVQTLERVRDPDPLCRSQDIYISLLLALHSRWSMLESRSTSDLYCASQVGSMSRICCRTDRHRTCKPRIGICSTTWHTTADSSWVRRTTCRRMSRRTTYWPCTRQDAHGHRLHKISRCPAKVAVTS